jgi:hypothetical protein
VKQKQVKLAVILFFTQIVMYGTITYNYRMIAQARVPEALLSDLLYGSLGFFVIKKVANDTGNAIVPWVGYSLGGVVGTYLGIVVSRVLIV